MQFRLLTAARLFGSAALTMVALVAVDMPEGYLGSANELTLFGTIYGALIALSAVAISSGLLRDVGWMQNLVPAVVSINVGLFVPALVADPLLSALFIVWHLILLGQYLFPERGRPAPVRERAYEPEFEAIEHWWDEYGPPARHLVVVALVVTVAVVGFELSRHWLVLTVCFLLNIASAAVASRFLWLLLQAGQRIVLLLLVPLALSLVLVSNPPLSLTMLAILQFLTLVAMTARGPLFNELLALFLNRPAILIAAAFGSVISLGTLLLRFPEASAGADPISVVDALFTATSAVCVTGLIVLDTPVAFSTFGHAIILALIQVGGLGIMVVSTFAAVIVGSRLGLRGERALGEALEIRDPKRAYQLTTFVVTATLIIEAVGAVFLSIGYRSYGLGWGEAIWRGVFHAVSAFCNAGFALQSDSLVMFQQDPLMLSVFIILIMAGSLGFLFMASIWWNWRHEGPTRWSVQVKVVVIASIALWLLGTVLYLAVEWNATLAGLDTIDRVVNGLFQSVTLRSAGFNTVDFGPLSGAALLFMLIFMYIGGAPGGTAGGVKITTLTVLLAAVGAIARGEPKVVIFHRRIDQDIIYRAVAIVAISVLVIASGFFLLLLSQDLPFEILLFEMVSGAAINGLSLGATPELSSFGKVVIIVAMYVGRIGPLGLALLLGGGKASPLRYPRTRMMVG